MKIYLLKKLKIAEKSTFSKTKIKKLNIILNNRLRKFFKKDNQKIWLMK